MWTKGRQVGAEQLAVLSMIARWATRLGSSSSTTSVNLGPDGDAATEKQAARAAGQPAIDPEARTKRRGAKRTAAKPPGKTRPVWMALECWPRRPRTSNCFDGRTPNY